MTLFTGVIRLRRMFRLAVVWIVIVVFIVVVHVAHHLYLGYDNVLQTE